MGAGPKPFAIIDGHAHVGTWRDPSFGGRATSLSDATTLYRALGFQGALLMATDLACNVELFEALAAHDGAPRFRMAWFAEPRQEDDFRALEQRASSLAVLKVHPSFLRCPVGDKSLAPYLDLAVEVGLPLVVHCGRWREVAGFEHALEGAHRYPTLAVVLSHMGGDEPLLVRAALDAIEDRRLGNVYLGTESVRQYWLVQEACERLGSSRLIFGSDYNLNHPAAFKAIIEALGLRDEQRAEVFGANLNGLLPAHQRFF